MSVFKHFVAVVFVLFTAASFAAERPNFVLFLADDISWDDVGCYGHPTLETPHIDELAENGLRFTNAYLTTSSCSPSRCSLITGRYPHNTGVTVLHTTLPAGHVLFPELLKDAGYYTVLSGKHHMGKNANTAFSKISGGKGPGKEADWVQLLQDRPMDRPFFCWYASTDAHRGWAINDEAPKYDPADVVVPPYLFDGPLTRQDLTGYYHEVSRFDHFVGEVARELPKQGVLKNTMLIVMADNGRPLPRCKTRLYDSGIKTPFVVHFPAATDPGITNSLVSAIDVAATVLDVAGIRKPAAIQGVSFAPLLKDPEATVRDVAFAEHNWHVYKSHERMVRLGEFLYIRNNFPDQQNLCKEAYIGGAGEELFAMHKANKLTDAQQNIFWNPCPAEELYHVGHDPDQLTNLAGRDEYASTLQQMRSLLERWTEETGDNVPANPTPDRDPRPGAEKRPRQKFQVREMPGDATGAVKINHPGPCLLD